jgi:transcriptional regulator with XRE-family HTH domain
MTDDNRMERTARQRLRSLRIARGWTLDDLATRAHMSASTISRIETGKRRLTIDALADLAHALGTSVDELLADHSADEVVIRPSRVRSGGATQWMLSRPHDPSGRVVAKMRLPASRQEPDLQVHPGRDWFYVLDGVARLVLGDRELRVAAGEAAEFDTMTPHWIGGAGGPVEIVSIFDRAGEHAHLR